MSDVTMAALEAVAEAWASIDGKLDKFTDCKAHLEDETSHGGYYSGYMEDARSLIKRIEKRGFRLVPIASDVPQDAREKVATAIARKLEQPVGHTAREATDAAIAALRACGFRMVTERDVVAPKEVVGAAMYIARKHGAMKLHQRLAEAMGFASAAPEPPA